ncbi:MAG: rod shape-determining protein MreC [Erysipelotrichaceae bacterium]
MKFTRYQKILFAIIAFLSSFIIITSSLQSAKSVSGVTYNAFTMLKYAIIDGPVAFVSDLVDDFQTLWQVHLENEVLKQEIAKMQFNAYEYQENTRQLTELKELLAIQDRYATYQKVNANVILRDQEMWNNYLMIDVGENQGLAKNMAVISSKGLIGRVEEVYPTSAKVKLLTTTDKSNKVSTKIIYGSNQSVDAVLESYDVNKKSFVVRLFSNNDDLKVGDHVVTSGMGGVFPPGINIGKINEIVNLNNQLGKTIYVTPDADFQNFQYVSVLKQGS